MDQRFANRNPLDNTVYNQNGQIPQGDASTSESETVYQIGRTLDIEFEDLYIFGGVDHDTNPILLRTPQHFVRENLSLIMCERIKLISKFRNKLNHIPPR